MRIERVPLSEVPAEDARDLIGDRVFADPAFAALWRHRGGRGVAWTARENGAFLAMLPGAEFGRRPWARFYSMPDGGYGGIFTRPGSGEAAGDLRRRLLDAVAGHGYSRAWIFDYYGTIDAAPGFGTLAQQTTLVDISRPGWIPPDTKLRSQIRKARREGIHVEPFRWDDHAEAFLAVMRDTERRHGRNTPWYPAPFFEELAALAGRDARIRWYWCGHEGKGVCSHIYVLESGVLQGWQIHFDKRYSWLKPNQYIRYSVCRDMAEHGIATLNLGGTPENAPGLSYYKRRWGGRAVTYTAWMRRSGLGRLR